MDREEKQNRLEEVCCLTISKPFPECEECPGTKEYAERIGCNRHNMYDAEGGVIYLIK